MTKEQLEQRKAELMAKIDEAKDDKELAELRNEIESLKNVEVVEEKVEEKIDERSLLKDAVQNLETRSLQSATVIQKPNEIKEERKLEEKEKSILEQRGADLKAGKKITVNLEKRAVTVASGDLLLQKKYKDTIDESFEGVSGLVDRVNSIQLNGGESYSVPFEVSYGEGGYTAEGADYSEAEPVVDYVETGRAKITAYTEITKEAIKLPNANYQALVIRRVIDAIRKKLGKQIIIGSGDENTIRGIYNASTKVLPTAEDKTADIQMVTIDADTLNTIVFAYGGDESVESEQVLILSKKDLEAFAKVKTEDGKFVYNVTRNGQTGTISYKDGGLEVPYVINSACNSLTNIETPTGTYTMIYGSLSSYELPVFSALEVQESKDYKFRQGVICYSGDVIVGGTVSKYNGFVRVKKIAAV
jgi:HK97 family phage major capsid protein